MTPELERTVELRKPRGERWFMIPLHTIVAWLRRLFQRDVE